MCNYHVPMLILYSTLILAVLDVQTKNILYETVLSYTIVVLHYYMNKVIIIIIPVVDWIIVINVYHLVLLNSMITENYSSLYSLPHDSRFELLDRFGWIPWQCAKRNPIIDSPTCSVHNKHFRLSFYFLIL